MPGGPRLGRVRVFLSYRRRDCTWAAQCLKYALRSGGHDAFLDTGAIVEGAAFREVIRDALAGSDLVLALVGPAFDVDRLREPADAVSFEWRQARFLGCAVHPVLVDGARMPAEQALPTELRWFCRRNASTLAGPALGAQIDALVAAVAQLATPPRPVRRVLWVDDNPANNEDERTLLREEGVVFDNVVSTAEAIEQLTFADYDLVITDLGRRGSSDRSEGAGRTLLRHPVITNAGPPVVVYAGLGALRQEAELEAAGAYGVAVDPVRLCELVRQALGRTPPDPAPPAAHLERRSSR